MSIIKTVTPLLTEENLLKFKQCIKRYKMPEARVIIDNAKEGLCPKSQEYITLDGVENDIINEIESSYDDVDNLASPIY